jgi:hypothetical protein
MSTENRMLVDVYFLIDTTGSMNRAIQGVKSEIAEVVSHFCRVNPEVDLAYGLGQYRDITDPNAFEFNQKINTNIDTLLGTLNGLTTYGGGDWPEDQVVPLSLINHTEAGWRPGALRLLAWYGDAPGHLNRVWNGHNYSTDTAIENLLEGNVIPIALSVGSNGLNSNGQTEAIVNATSGRYVNDVQYNQLCVTLFDEIAERLHLNPVEESATA